MLHVVRHLVHPYACIVNILRKAPIGQLDATVDQVLAGSQPVERGGPNWIENNETRRMEGCSQNKVQFRSSWRTSPVIPCQPELRLLEQKGVGELRLNSNVENGSPQFDIDNLVFPANDSC